MWTFNLTLLRPFTGSGPALAGLACLIAAGTLAACAGATEPTAARANHVPDAPAIPTNAPTQGATGAGHLPHGTQVHRTSYDVRLPRGWREMDSGELGADAVTACGPITCSDSIYVTLDSQQFDLPFDSQVSNRLSGYDYPNTERLADVEHDGQQVFHIVGSDEDLATAAYGMIGEFGTLSIEVTVQGRPARASAVADAVLAGFSFH